MHLNISIAKQSRFFHTSATAKTTPKIALFVLFWCLCIFLALFWFIFAKINALFRIVRNKFRHLTPQSATILWSVAINGTKFPDNSNRRKFKFRAKSLAHPWSFLASVLFRYLVWEALKVSLVPMGLRSYDVRFTWRETTCGLQYCPRVSVLVLPTHNISSYKIPNALRCLLYCWRTRERISV